MALVVPSANLTDETIASSFDQLLFLDNAAGILEATLKIVSTETGKSALQIAAEKVAIQAADSDPTNQVELFRVNNAAGTVILDVDGTNQRVGVGTATPGALLEVEQGASGGDVAFIIDNNDTDEVAMSIEAANIDADVIDISADAVTTAKVIDISATGLTDGILINTASTSTVTDGGSSTLVATAMTNDGVADQTAKGILLDYNKTGVTASGKTANVVGLQIDMDDSVTNVGEVNMTGLEIDVDFGNAGGTVKNIGLDVAVAAGGIDAGTNYAALFNGGNVGIGTTAPHLTFDVVHGANDDAMGIRFAPVAYAAHGNKSAIYFGTDGEGHSAILMMNDSGGVGSRLSGGHDDGGGADCTWFTDGVRIGSDSASNAIDDTTTGSGSQQMWIGNQYLSTTSDKRIKKDIVNTESNGLETVNKFRVVDYTWNYPEDLDENNINLNGRGRWTGFLAQETVEVAPYSVNAPRSEDGEIDNDSENTWGMSYEQLVPILTKAIQELSAKVTALENA